MELEHLRKLFVGGLNSVTTIESLREFYSQYGTIVDCVVMRDQNKKSRGFGFVTFNSSSMVDEAQNGRPHVIDGKQVEAKRVLPRPDAHNADANASVKKIFIGGLKDNHDEEILKDYFSKFGSVLNIKIICDKATGRKRGFAYVEFDDYDSVDKAVYTGPHTIDNVMVDVKKSIYKKNENNQQQQQQNNNQGPPNNDQQNSGGPPNWNGWGQQPGPPSWGPNTGGNYSQPPANWNWGPPPPMYWGWNQGNWGPPPPQPQTNGWTWGPNGWQQQAVPSPNMDQHNAPQQDKNSSGPPPSTAPPQNYAPPNNHNSSNTNSGGYSQPPNDNSYADNSNGSSWNFGSGYTQNYNGGPAKNPNPTRMNPYNSQSTYGSHPNNKWTNDSRNNRSSSNRKY